MRTRLILTLLVVALSACSGSSGGNAGIAQQESLPASASQPSVLQYHKNASHDGVYVDPKIPKSAISGLQLSTAFGGKYTASVYAQPLYLENGVPGHDVVYVATEQNQLFAFDAATGATLWQKTLGPPVSQSDLLCGNIDPLGITGTPVIDPGSQTIYLDAMTTPDNGSSFHHEVFALSTVDGSTRAGWPVDVGAALAAEGQAFVARDQNQRGALTILNGTVYIPYGGHFGDCGTYSGWVVAIDAKTPSKVSFWKASSSKGGVWAPGGVCNDGSSVYVGTGNTEGATQWSGGDAYLKLGPGATFSGATTDYFAPSDWQKLDASDLDIGSAGPVSFDLSGQSPGHYLAGFGKNGYAYVLDRGNLGGLGKPLTAFQASSSAIISAPTVYSTASGTYLAFKAVCTSGSGGDLMALKFSSKNQLTTAWCATQNGKGSPIFTTTDGSSNGIVWSLGAEGDNSLHAFDAETGASLFKSSELPAINRFQTPIEAKGRIYIATSSGLVMFQMR